MNVGRHLRLFEHVLYEDVLHYAFLNLNSSTIGSGHALLYVGTELLY